MRKLFALLFTVLLLFTVTAVPAAATDIQAELVDFICTRYDLEPEDFEVAETCEVHLENLDLNVTLLTWVTQGTEHRKGQVGWVKETGEFFDGDEVMELMESERREAALEYEKLQNLAGKMDVSLYKSLTEMAPDEKVEIIIVPAYQMTAELEKQIKDLYDQYDLTPPETPWDPQRRVGSAESGGGQSGSVDGRMPADTGQDLAEPAFPGTLTPLPAPDLPAGDIPDVPSDDPAPDIYDPYPQEFTEALNALYFKAYEQSTAILVAYLDDLGADYEVVPGRITAKVTAEQALDMRDLDDLQWIGSQEYWAVEDLAPGFPDGREPAIDNDLARTAGESVANVQQPGKGSWLWAGGLMAVMALGVFLILKK